MLTGYHQYSTSTVEKEWGSLQRLQQGVILDGPEFAGAVLGAGLGESSGWFALQCDTGWA